MTTCALCLNESPLHVSHIMPASLHKHVKTEGKNVHYELPGKINLNNQKDLKERLLCGACEQKFSKFEKTAIERLRDVWKTSKGPEKAPVGRQHVEPIMSFVHSVFWRASLSTQLHRYKLPGDVEERLRCALYTGKTILPPELSVSIYRFEYLRRFGAADIIHAPRMNWWNSTNISSSFLAMGLIFVMEAPYQFSQSLRAGTVLTPDSEVNFIRAAPKDVAFPSVLAINEARDLTKRSPNVGAFLKNMSI
ncbi:hypothetical protein [Caballeronia sp. ATUFL_F2_KS42]|uniref:hypothetical protein n=2 Tax=unclassified Caballeronia TaxID=2646786 RepID=UPI0020277E6A|nr:hypothetical protein [Caballeronia sp. ATUFL_F2_KS42]